MTLASCDSRKTAGENPFFTEWDTPHGVPPFDKILPEHFMPAFERGMSLHEAEIDAITSNKDEATFENTILAYDNAGQMLAQTERTYVEAALRLAHGNVSQAARLLGINRTTLYNRMESLAKEQ